MFYYIFLLSRVLFGGYFIMNGINHLVKGKHMVGYAQSKHVPMPKLMIALSGVLMLAGGAGLLFGYYILISVVCLALFIVPTTFIMHAFWKQTDTNMRMMEYIQFTKNLALLGGALAFLFI